MNCIEWKEQNKTKLSTDNFNPDLLKPFQDEQNLIEFIVRRPALQEILKEVLQYKEKWGQMENRNYTKNESAQHSKYVHKYKLPLILCF